jgi:hypothetical protein
MRILLTLVVGFLCSACGGTFEEAKHPHVKLGLAPPSARCIALDDRRAFYGGTSKFSAVLSGGAGLATIPVKDDKLQAGLAISSAVLAGVAVGTGFVSDSASTSWVRECSQ